MKETDDWLKHHQRVRRMQMLQGWLVVLLMVAALGTVVYALVFMKPEPVYNVDPMTLKEKHFIYQKNIAERRMTWK